MLISKVITLLISTAFLQPAAAVHESHNIVTTSNEYKENGIMGAIRALDIKKIREMMALERTKVLIRANDTVLINSRSETNNGTDTNNVDSSNKPPPLDTFFDPANIMSVINKNKANNRALVVQAATALGAGVAIILLFGILRILFKHLYSPRLSLKTTSPNPISDTIFGWIMPTIRTTDSYIMNALGLDSYIFLKFYKMCTKILFQIAIMSLVVIYPTKILFAKKAVDEKIQNYRNMGNFEDANRLEDDKVVSLLFDTTSLLDYDKHVELIALEILFSYVFTALIFFHLTRFTSQWGSLRWHFMLCSREAMVSRTVMVTLLPKFLSRSVSRLKWLFEDAGRIGEVEEVAILPKNRKNFLDLVSKRSQALSKLEKEYVRILGNPCKSDGYSQEELYSCLKNENDVFNAQEKDYLRKHCKKGIDIDKSYQKLVGLKQKFKEIDLEARKYNVDHSEHYEKRVEKNDSSGEKLYTVSTTEELIKFPEKKARKAKQATRPNAPTADLAFITFKDAASAHLACQTSIYPNPYRCTIDLAPEPRGIYWPNFKMSLRKRRFRADIRFWTILALFIVWVVPVSLTTSLLSVSSLSSVSSIGDYMSSHPNFQAFMVTTVPSLVLVLVSSVMPFIFKKLVFFGGARSLPEMDTSVLSKTWMFFMYTTVFIMLVSGTLWDVILNVFDQPSSVLRRAASLMPGLSSFFISYLTLLGIAYQPLKLLLLRPSAWYFLRFWLCSTPRDYAKLAAPVYIDWYNVYPYPMVVFFIALLYSTFSPLTLIFGLLYYLIGYLIMKYLLVYVYFRCFETSGIIWPVILVRITLSVLLFQLLMTFFVVVKSNKNYLIFAMLPLIVLSLMYLFMYSLKVESRFKYIPLYLLYNTPPSDSYNTSSSSFLSKNRRNQLASHRIHHPPLATFAYSKHKRQRSDTFSDPSKYSQRKNHIYPYHRFPNKSGLQLAEPNDKLRQRTQIQLMKKANHLARSRPSQSRAFRHAQNLVSNAERRCRTDNWGLPLFYHRNKSGDQSSSSHSSSTIPSATASIQSNSFEADSHNLKGDLNRTRASTYSNDSDSDYVTDTAPSAPKIHFTSTKTNSFPNARSLSVARSGSRSFFGSIGMIFTYTLVLCRKSFSFLGEFLISIRRFAFRKFNPASAIFDLSMSKKFGNTYTQISAKKKTNSTLAIPCNYQIYSASAQYNLQKSRHCDYRQPPMSLIQGILQGAIVDYHYPGYNKNFPALWLPVSS